MRTLLTFALLVGLAGQASAPRVLTATFSEAKGLAEWEPDGNGTWHMHAGFLALDKEGVPEGPIRRPGAMAIFRSAPLTDFTMRVELRSTAPIDLLVRDVLLIFGYRSPTQFYYVHLAAKTDAVHNGVFLVNNADRRRLDEPTSTAKLTDQSWHRARLERNATTGSIRVFFDDSLMLSATDKTLTSGRIGIGSFDETGEFRGLEVESR